MRRIVLRPTGSAEGPVRTNRRGLMPLAVVVALAACAPIPGATDATPSSDSSVAPSSSTESIAPAETAGAASATADPTEQPAAFPMAAFAAISEEPVTEESAAQFQAALEDAAAREEMGEGGGMTATVMTADGTWSGMVGKADDARDLRVDDQFAIASITKSIVAAQAMSMVEAGELGLDDLAA